MAAQFPNLSFNSLGEIVTLDPIWEGITDENLLDLAQLQARYIGFGRVVGMQLRVRVEIERRQLMPALVDLVAAGCGIPEEIQ